MSTEKITFDKILEGVTYQKPMETLIRNRIMQITIHDISTLHSKLCYVTKDNLYQLLQNFIQDLDENLADYIMAISYDNPPANRMRYSGQYIHSDLVRYYFVKDINGVRLFTNTDPIKMVNLENGIIIQRACSKWDVPVYEIGDSDNVLTHHRKFTMAIDRMINGNVDIPSYQECFNAFIDAVNSADERVGVPPT